MASKWNVIKSAQSYILAVNLVYPKRDKRSDGTIGDAAHASSTSDHNPDKTVNDGDPVGTVKATDTDKDLGKPAIPAPSNASILVENLRKAGKTRKTPMRYIIWNGRICGSRDYCIDNGIDVKYEWEWTSYKGKNKHTEHIHISYDSGKWSNQFFDWIPTITKGLPPIPGVLVTTLANPINSKPSKASSSTPAPAQVSNAAYLTIDSWMIEEDQLGDGSGHVVWSKLAGYIERLNKWSEKPLTKDGGIDLLIAFNANPKNAGYPAASSWRGPLVGNRIAYPTSTPFK